MNANTSARFGSAVRSVDPRAPGLTMIDALSYFVRRPSAQLLALLFTVALTARIALGELGPWDLAVAAGMVALHPLTEWLIHVEILHFRPRLWRGRVVDIPIAHDHRAHHADPHDPRWWFIPAQSLLTGFAFLVATAWLLMPTIELALTMIAAMVALGTAYEWTHFLCHSSWRPRSAWYRRLWKLHRLHHFKNENYWMGVTMHAADRVLGTLPDVADVETSPTCRNLDQR